MYAQRYVFLRLIATTFVAFVLTMTAETLSGVAQKENFFGTNGFPLRADLSRL
jgi:hypothetical protein